MTFKITFKNYFNRTVQEANERILKVFAEDCSGIFSTLAPAVESAKKPRLKATRSVSVYKGTLTLGDPEKYDSALSIEVERYPRTMVAKPPTASSFVVRTDLGGAQSSTQSTTTVVGDGDDVQTNGQLASVKSQRVYQVDDEDNPGAKKNIDYDEISRGFEYGRTAVPISESESNIVKIESEPKLDIIGFVPEERVWLQVSAALTPV